jgi:hypothetical protein
MSKPPIIMKKPHDNRHPKQSHRHQKDFCTLFNTIALTANFSITPRFSQFIANDAIGNFVVPSPFELARPTSPQLSGAWGSRAR